MANFINPTRKCAHPAGCEMLAAPGDIYCEGCATDPHLHDADDPYREERVPAPFAHPSRVAPSALALVSETDARYPYGVEACTPSR